MALLDHAQAIFAPNALYRQAAGHGLLIQIAAQGLQACRVGEVDQGDLPQLHRLGAARQDRRDNAVGAHHEVFMAYRQLDRGGQRQALGVDQHAFGIELQLPAFGVVGFAVRRFDLEETRATDRQVHRLAGGLDIAFGEDFLRAHHPHTAPHLNTGRHGIDFVRLGARRHFDGVEQIFKHHAVTFETGGVDVGQVVGHGGHRFVLRGKAGLTDPECGAHVLFPVGHQLPRIMLLPAVDKSSAAFIILTWVSNNRLRLMVPTSSSMAETLLASR